MKNERPAKPSRILVVRLGAMGDVIHAMPAVGALRHALPGCEIGWAIEERWRALLCSCANSCGGSPNLDMPLVDAVHVVDTKNWRRAIGARTTREQVRAAIRAIREREYDVAIDFQGAIKSALLARVSGAERRFGFATPREKLAAMLYSSAVEAEGAHVIEQNFSLASHVAGKTLTDARAIFPVDARAREWRENVLNAHEVCRYGILTPGAGWGAKCWPAERYAAVARELSSTGLKLVINYGPAEEALARAVQTESAGAAKMIPCGIAELIELTRGAQLFIGGDTGPMHLAAALGVPVVALFGPTDPARNGPYGTRSIVLRSEQSRTSYSHRAMLDAGLMSITVAEVTSAAMSLLGVQ
ncbi:MAG TPA: lipopolysaccharide heptosyltransferase I [Clostridia bacterium]|nr:lipopolysaccharide heptosyltransferase I [Clostridia bacterium]